MAQSTLFATAILDGRNLHRDLEFGGGIIRLVN
jgi:hypothetical protein